MAFAGQHHMNQSHSGPSYPSSGLFQYGQQSSGAQHSAFPSNYGHPANAGNGYNDLLPDSSMSNMDGLGITGLHSQGLQPVLAQLENRIDGRLLEQRDRIERLER